MAQTRGLRARVNTGWWLCLSQAGICRTQNKVARWPNVGCRFALASSWVFRLEAVTCRGAYSEPAPGLASGAAEPRAQCPSPDLLQHWKRACLATCYVRLNAEKARGGHTMLINWTPDRYRRAVPPEPGKRGPPHTRAGSPCRKTPMASVSMTRGTLDRILLAN